MQPLIAGISVVGAQKEQKFLPSKTKQIFKLQHEFNESYQRGKRWQHKQKKICRTVSVSNFGFGYEDVIQQESHPLKQAFQNMMIPTQLDPFALRWEPC